MMRLAPLPFGNDGRLFSRQVFESFGACRVGGEPVGKFIPLQAFFQAGPGWVPAAAVPDQLADRGMQAHLVHPQVPDDLEGDQVRLLLVVPAVKAWVTRTPLKASDSSA